MAFIYMSGGWVLRVPTTRDGILASLKSQPPGGLLEYEVDAPSGRALSPTTVTVAAAQIAVISDAPLPRF